MRIEYAESVIDDLARLRAYERAYLLDRIEAQLTYQPAKPTRHKKIIIGLVPPWDHIETVWELRIGVFRVFYDVDEEQAIVSIRAIRRKPPHKTTEEII